MDGSREYLSDQAHEKTARETAPAGSGGTAMVRAARRIVSFFAHELAGFARLPGMRWWVILGVLAGCGVELRGGGSANKPVDAGPSDVDSAPDAAAPDALPCTGGDSHATAPDGTCLVLFTGPHTWITAQASCSTIHAHLAVLHDAAIDTAAEQLVGALDAYIGLTDQVTEGMFVWVDGTPAAFTNWRTGEPSDGGGMYPEDCAVIAGGRTGGGWDDRPCAVIPDVGGADYAALCQR